MRKDWENKKLGEIGTIITGSTPSTKDNSNYLPQEYCFVKPSDLIEYGISKIEKTEFYVSKKGFSISRALPAGTVLVSCIGSIGKIGVLTKEACSNQQINAIVPFDNIDSFYLAYILSGMKYKFKEIANAPVVPIINKTAFSKVIIPIPPMPTQLAIVAELDKLNEMIRLKKKQLEDYDQLAQSIFYEMFGDPVENEKGWEVKKLGEVCIDITDGDHMPPPKASKGIPFITISNINKETRELNFENTFFVSEEYYNNLKDNRKARLGDLLYTVTGSYGIPVTVETNIPFCFQRHIALIRPKQNVLSTKYLCFWVLCENVKSMADRAATGIAQKTVGLNTIRNFKVILPPLPLQQQFAARIEAIEQQKQQVKDMIKDLETLLASRMQYWFDFTPD